MATDGWTSRTVTNYMSLTIHYVNAEFVNEHISLGVMHLSGRHTGVNIQAFLSDTLAKWDLSEMLKNKNVYFASSKLLK